MEASAQYVLKCTNVMHFGLETSCYIYEPSDSYMEKQGGFYI